MYIKPSYIFRNRNDYPVSQLMGSSTKNRLRSGNWEKDQDILLVQPHSVSWPSNLDFFWRTSWVLSLLLAPLFTSRMYCVLWTITIILCRSESYTHHSDLATHYIHHIHLFLIAKYSQMAWCISSSQPGRHITEFSDVNASLTNKFSVAFTSDLSTRTFYATESSCVVFSLTQYGVVSIQGEAYPLPWLLFVKINFTEV